MRLDVLSITHVRHLDHRKLHLLRISGFHHTSEGRRPRLTTSISEIPWTPSKPTALDGNISFQGKSSIDFAPQFVLFL